MSGVWEWIRSLRAAATKSRSRRGFRVERLEPRQLLAADCLFFVEVFPSEGLWEEQIATEPWVESWQPEESHANLTYTPNSEHGSSSVFDEGPDFYLIHLEDVIDEIGEFYEIDEGLFSDPGYGELDWFS